ncbi:MAG TPA: ATPase, T2SS/T4P/T4SS family [Armatimonadota bacterium]|jgi:type II secretory ATPase GspE/PulE/Tfp pilus assembly ATPase PilB-like protein
MTCEEARDEMVAYAKGQLPATDAAVLEEHLVRCEGCQKELENARQILALTQMADDSSIRDLVDRLLGHVLALRGSDLHLEVGEAAPRVRVRVDGALQAGPEVTREQYEPVIARIKLMAGMDAAERKLPQDGRIPWEADGQEYELRVSVIPCFNGESAVLRVLNRSSVFVGMDRLGLRPEMLARVQELLSSPWGLLLVSGPTGSGKTTTLYSMVAQVNTPRVKVLTVEDPVEYHLPGLNQIAVDRRTGLTYGAAVRSVMRQDPDIVLIGEIQDLETLELAASAALTGHLVLSNLHAKDAASSVTRLVDAGLEPYRAASSLLAVLAQRLVRINCPHCREPYKPSPDSLAMLGVTDANRPARFLRGRGCDRCNRGVRGRRGLFELLVMDPELSRLVATRAPEEDLRRAARERGLLTTFSEDGLAKVAAGDTTVEEVARVLGPLASAPMGRQA